MEHYKLYEIGQILYASGNDVLKLLLQDMPCIPHHGTIELSRNFTDYNIDIDVPTDDDKLHVMSVALLTDMAHAISIIVNNKNRTYTILDSSGHDNKVHTFIINKVFSSKGYTNRPHTCPRNLLPQQDDALCTAWSMYMIYMACQGIDPVDIPIRAKKEGLISFLLDSWIKLQGTDVLNNYRRYRRIYSNYIINNLTNLLSKVSPHKYRMAIDKEEFLDSIDLDFDIKTNVDREGDTYHFFNTAVKALNTTMDSYIIKNVVDAKSMDDIIDVISNYYGTYFGRYMVYTIFATLFSHHDNIEDSVLDSLSPDEVNTVLDNYIKYKEIISIIAEGMDINRDDYDDEVKFITDIRNRIIGMGLSFDTMFPDNA